jgi:hypothetical protein
MSTISKYKCDYCGRDTDDMYNYIGWIRFEGGSLCVSKGRKQDKTADNKFISLATARHLDFCCLDCLVNYLKFDKKEGEKLCSVCGK